MTLDSQVTLEWKNKNTLKISGPIDASFGEDLNLKKFPNVFYLDLNDISRINSSGVRQWVRFIQSLDKKKVCYINVSCPVVEQFSMVSEIIGRYNTVKSFNARYICDNCNSPEICSITVGTDILPGLDEYTEAPVKHCKNCAETMEFDHDPESYFYFLTILQNDPREFVLPE